MNGSTLGELRREYHRRLCDEILSRRRDTQSFNIADSSSKASVAFAERMIAKINQPLCAAPPSGQTAGTRQSPD
jgi:hypothetical protein